MKKIALFSLMCCLGVSGVGAATYNCEVQEISSLSWKVSNEFLFPTYGDYNDANGRAYVCGHRGIKGCDSGAMVLIAGEHYFTNDRQEDELYRCSTNGANAWAKSNKDVLPKCTSDQIKTFTLFGEMPVGKRRIYCKNAVGTYSAGGRCVGRNAGDICWTDYCEDCDKQKPQCFSSYDGKTFNVGQSDTFSCDKYPEVDPNKQYYLTGKNCYRTCLEKSDGGVVILQSIKECKDNTYTHIDFSSSERARYKTTIPGFKKCEKKSEPVKPGFCDKYKQWDKRYACCLAGKDTEWKGKDLSNDGTCVCKDGSKWEYNEKNKRGKCVANETPVPPVVEEDKDCFKYISARIRCNNGNSYSEEGWQKVKQSEFASMSCEEIKKSLDEDTARLVKLFKELCEEKQPDIYVPQPQTGPSPYEVEQAQNVLSSFTASAKDEASVWKTAEGNFNGARLASDITAGVVLGTVGGVVTGNIIKKNQVKKGFEALHCTVGGQKVADWGDEFSVGLQR